MSRLRSRALFTAGVFLLLTSVAVADTTGATTTTEPEGTEDVATASTSPATGESSGVWTNAKGDAGRTGVADAGPTGEPVEVWRFEGGLYCHRQPAVVAGVVYAPCHDGILYALDAATGTERWRFTGTDLGAVTAVGDLVYVEVFDVDGPRRGDERPPRPRRRHRAGTLACRGARQYGGGRRRWSVGDRDGRWLPARA